MSPVESKDAPDSDELVAVLGESSPSLELVLKGLQGDTWLVRRAAAQAAAKLPDIEAAAQALLALAESSNPDVRAAVAEAFLAMGRSTVPFLSKALSARRHDMPVRRLIIEVLGALESPAALQALKSALDDADPNVRMSAAEALGRVGGPGAAEALLRRLANEDFMVSSAVAQALWNLDAHVPFETAAALLQDKRLVRPALKLLGLTGDARALAPLVDALASRPRPRREAAVLAAAKFLSRCPMSLVRDFLAEADKRRADICSAIGSAIQNDAPEIRQSALDVAALLGWPEILPDLLSQSIQSDAGELALAAVTAIIEEHGLPDDLGPERLDPEARQLLYLGAAQANRQSEAETESSLHRLLEQARRDLQSPQHDVALAAAGLLAIFGTASDIQPVLELARESRQDVLGLDEVCASLGTMAGKYPKQVTALLGRLPDEDLRPILPRVAAHMQGTLLVGLAERLVTSRDKTTKRAGLLAFSHLPGSKSREQILWDILDDPDPDLRASAAQATPANCSNRFLQKVSNLLQDHDPEVRRAACLGLGRSNRLDAADALETLLKRGDNADVTVEALNASIRLGARLEGRLLIALMSHQDGDVAKAALDAARTGEAEPIIVQTARKLLDSPRWDLRAEALRTLAYHGAHEEVEELLHETLRRERDETVLDVARSLLAE